MEARCGISIRTWLKFQMAFTPTQMAVLVGGLGIVSFIFGIVAETQKPPAGEPIIGKDVVICKYPSDPSVALGYISFAFLVASTIVGYVSLFYPYKGKSIPQSEAFRNCWFNSYYNIALGTTGFAATFLLWPTITEQLHLMRNVHHDLETSCPTAKTGLLGGGAFASLNASLFWLVALMLVNNVREDYFEQAQGIEESKVVTIG
ncbi:hypothetical protein ACH5RR_040907 [Cinchona calisaya]|uniref:Uncharacterized protein n=1 Tax=Cinchona calisaya TaxID=153742 RepID=A0ABD2XXF1_9GENT